MHITFVPQSRAANRHTHMGTHGWGRLNQAEWTCIVCNSHNIQNITEGKELFAGLLYCSLIVHAQLDARQRNGIFDVSFTKVSSPRRGKDTGPISHVLYLPAYSNAYQKKKRRKTTSIGAPGLVALNNEAVECCFSCHTKFNKLINTKKENVEEEKKQAEK